MIGRKFATRSATPWNLQPFQGLARNRTSTAAYQVYLRGSSMIVRTGKRMFAVNARARSMYLHGSVCGTHTNAIEAGTRGVGRGNRWERRGRI